MSFAMTAINALVVLGYRYGNLLKNVVENEEDYADAAGGARLEYANANYELMVGNITGLLKTWMESRNIAERQFGQQVDQYV